MDRRSCSGLPSAPGIYVLELELAEGTAFELRGREVALGPGTYLYVGSAGGPGGLRARICRHLRAAGEWMRRKGRVGTWHVDSLLAAGRPVGAYLLVGRSGRRWEVAAAESLKSRLEPALEGFGNTDTGGATHLFRARSGMQVDEALMAVAEGWTKVDLGLNSP